MKNLNLLLPITILLVFISSCKDEENNDPVTQTANWGFNVAFNITEPDTSWFDATGTAVAEYTESTYTISANYLIGNVDFEGVLSEGDINNGVWDFTNKTLQIDFQNGDIQFTEVINFSVTALNTDGGITTGTGDITIENVDAGTTESGTFEFTANAMLPK